MEPGKHFVITLIKGKDELPRDYVSRCNAIAAFARERSSIETPTATINLDHATQVSETAYQIVTPGYTSPEEQASERDTHFASFAHPLIARLQEATQHGRRLTEETPVNVEKLRTCWKDEMLPAMLALWEELVRTDEDARFIQRQIEDWENIIPAMAEWPEEKGE